jgi:spore coat polysaccharide biosynthesis predicted glycosyltransferase SpsG
MSTPSYIFVVDTRDETGLGHQGRCISISDALLIQQPDALIRFVAVGASTSLFVSVNPALDLTRLPTDVVIDNPLSLMSNIMGNTVFIIDHYILNNKEWLGRLRLLCPTALVYSFDDNEEGATWPVYGLLRIGVSAKKDDLSEEVINNSAIGVEFFPIRSDADPAKYKNRIYGKIGNRMLVTLGGSDQEKYTERVVRALAGIPNALNFDIVFGPTADSKRAKAIIPDERFMLHNAPANFLDLMRTAFLAICGGGNTCYEFMHFGVPMSVLALAKNQYGTCEAIQRKGYGHFLGYIEKMSDHDLTNQIKTFISNSIKYRAMAEKSRRLIDGRGAERLAKKITASIASNFTD